MQEIASAPTGHAPERSASSSGLYVIGIYKLLEAALLAAAGFGVLKLLHRDVGEMLEHLVHAFRADPDNRFVHALLEKGFSVSPKQLRELSVGTFVYAALRLAEGTGLVLRKRWGEYLTVAVTALFIPVEIWELIHHFTWVKVVVFAGNVAILVYLIYALRRSGKREEPQAMGIGASSQL